MNNLLRKLFIILVAYPVVLVWLGVSVSKRERLPKKGPAIIVGNHNSHLDTLTLLTLFPLSLISDVHPAAAADYFMKNKWFAWFSTKVIGIIPVERKGGSPKEHDPLAGCVEALKNNKILILFPEGTRGEPEQMSELKSGLWFLCQQCPDVPVIPVYMHGLGRAMGKGQRIPVPFFIDVYIDEPMYVTEDENKTAFIEHLKQRFETLQDKAYNGRNHG
ncbi:lysophospholipid acyltransferase family protein [Neisseria sp. Ec49-e6-T10]|uniref:lysophospholipid acyltransferase family protein n=1 Tax=Neisseria sp. Ec49-e6-T10 TaxID=3140744 RepID=UPI003EBFB001